MASGPAPSDSSRAQASTSYRPLEAEHERALDDYIHGRITVEEYMRIVARYGRWSEQLIKQMSTKMSTNPRGAERLTRLLRFAR